MWDRSWVNTIDLLLHPVRLRIVHVMSGGEIRTTTQLCERLPDIPKTTLYRHVALLVDAKVLEVVEERRIKGAVERVYRLRKDRPQIDEDTARSMTLEDHRHAFAASMASLLADFNAYLDADGADPAADLIGYRQGLLWLTPAEVMELVEDMLTVIRARAGNQPEPERKKYTLSAIFFPTNDPPARGGKTYFRDELGQLGEPADRDAPASGDPRR
jgi:DNA-binding transcriptional ArsR family regulator